jgi:MoxR-like ATPase
VLSLIEFTRDYLLPRRASRPPARAEADHGLVVTGEPLVTSIYEAIVLRRSVLVTGPRGCGKTFCVKEAIKRAFDDNRIGGWHFLQGNREIPRDYVSEDMLVINREGHPELLDALAIRPPASAEARERARLIRGGDVPPESRGVSDARFPCWPAIPAITLHKLRREKASKQWTPWAMEQDWVVLFLDEINRFGDGFLDSLLSLTEEGIVVRGGDEYHVPVVVVATANPPGYDVTAKKLSPPLQARIGRSYRVSQPPLDHLVNVVLSSKEEMFGTALGKAIALDDREKYLAAAATLCLWGNPDKHVRGAAFLTVGTRELLRQAMTRNVRVKAAMTELSGLIQFGPDARAIGEWIGAAAVEAKLATVDRISPVHLIRTASAVLGHKLRESFNEGSEPEKLSELQRCIHDIVSLVLTKPAYEQLFVLPYGRAALQLGLSQSTLFTRITKLPDERRWHPWLWALADLSVSRDAATFHAWRGRHTSDKRQARAFAVGGTFFTYEERRWFEHTLLANAPDTPADSDGATCRAALLQHLGQQSLTSLESSVRYAFDQTPCAVLFARDLVEVAKRNERFLSAQGTGEVQQTWVDAVDRLVDPHGGDPAAVIGEAKTRLGKLGASGPAATKVLVEALQVVQSSAVDPEIRERALGALRLLRP